MESEVRPNVANGVFGGYCVWGNPLRIKEGALRIHLIKLGEHNWSGILEKNFGLGFKSPKVPRRK